MCLLRNLSGSFPQSTIQFPIMRKLPTTWTTALTAALTFFMSTMLIRVLAMTHCMMTRFLGQMRIEKPLRALWRNTLSSFLTARNLRRRVRAGIASVWINISTVQLCWMGLYECVMMPMALSETSIMICWLIHITMWRKSSLRKKPISDCAKVNSMTAEDLRMNLRKRLL